MLKYLKIIGLVFLFIFTKNELIAQDSLNCWQLFKSDISNCYYDYKQLADNIFNPSSDVFIKIGGLAGATYIAYQFDERLRFSENKRKSVFAIKQMGEATVFLSLASIIYAYGLLGKDEDVRTSGRLLVESLAYSGLINLSLKFTLGRARPFVDKGANKFEFFETTNSYNSMPSGHTTIAFTIATVLSERIDKWWAYIGLYSCAGLTAYERIKSDNHWFSDVILAAGIGHLSSMAVLNANKDINKNQNAIQYHSYLLPTSEGIQAGVIFSF
jgi:hypothetical protein